MALPPDRVVFFLDILGFSELVRACAEKPELVESLLQILTEYDDLKSSMRANLLRPDGLEITTLSDGIVVSAPFESFRSELDLEWLFVVTAVSTLAVRLLKEGFPVRGAGTIGWLHHSSDIVFGEGLLEAYRLERSVAIYPRLILSESLVERFGLELCYRDKDGQATLNWMLLGAKGNEDLSKLSGVIARILEAKMSDQSTPEGVIQKYHWLANTYNERVPRTVGYVPKPSGWAR